MKKVLYVPLDDRDCNYDFPYQLSLMTDCLSILRPERALMGSLKRAAERNIAVSLRLLRLPYRKAHELLRGIGKLSHRRSGRREAPMQFSGRLKEKLSAMLAPITAKLSCSGSSPPDSFSL